MTTDDGESPTAAAPAPHGGRSVVTAGAPRGGTEVVVLALHGRGATAQGVVNLLDPVYRHGVTFLAPDAHRSRWYPYAATAGRERNDPDLSSAIAVVDALVAHATSAFDVPRERVVLAGFSQGAVVAAEYALQHPARYGAVVCLAGAAIDPERDFIERHGEDAAAASEDATAGSFAGTPAYFAVGRDDPHVPISRVEATADAFRARGADVTVDVFDDTGHEVTDAAFDHVRALLDGIVDGD
ncbi:phospholipase [Halorubellus sp. JP-L1]|uniref:alpha/beta hydrolase n=1 Tax=Halorubellus sp. JP-L1 TaxID=2715753 RepID=UPI00140AF1ED|nr:dienelactone hydrolase family protein [Halorubellus sp. JP-L1]NHN41540.1 phospholipase [Halorubellus sp. JP-L1]